LHLTNEAVVHFGYLAVVRTSCEMGEAAKRSAKATDVLP